MKPADLSTPFGSNAAESMSVCPMLGPATRRRPSIESDGGHLGATRLAELSCQETPCRLRCDGGARKRKTSSPQKWSAPWAVKNLVAHQRLLCASLVPFR